MPFTRFVKARVRFIDVLRHFVLEAFSPSVFSNQVNRAKVAQAMVAALSGGDEGTEVGGVLLLAGGHQQTRYALGGWRTIIVFGLLSSQWRARLIVLWLVS
jgi:hypothetical protein